MARQIFARAALLVLPLVSGALSAQEPTNPTAPPQADTAHDAAAQRIDERLNDLIVMTAPGLAVKVRQGDQVLFQKAYGIADLAHRAPVTNNAKFRIGSVTKHITAAAILKLAEQGKLSIDDTLDKFLPDFPRASEVTLAQLMDHTSGIFSYTNAPDFFETVRLKATEEQLIESIKSHPYDFNPGTNWSYNNSAYFILGHIVSKVSGKPFAEFLHDEFFAPLDMDQTGIHSPELVLRDEAYGYTLTSEGYQKALDWDMSRAGGAGAIYSTTDDLDRWARAYFAGQVIKPELVELATSSRTIEQDGKPRDLHYGFGWFIDTQRGLRRISHGGGLQGFLSHLAYYPEHDLTIVVFHNAFPSVPAVQPAAISQMIAEVYLQQYMTNPADRVTDTSVTADTMSKYVGRYDYQSAVMDVTLEEDHLFAQLTGQSKFEIFPADSTTFFWKAVEAEVTFQVDSSGNVTGALHKQGGAEFIAPKLPPQEEVKLTPEQLDALVGVYDIERLGEATVTREKSQLFVQVTGQPRLAVFATDENNFFYKIIPATITFSDPQDGQTQTMVLKQAGLVLTGKRI